MEIKDDILNEMILLLCYFIRHLSHKSNYNDIDRVKKLRKELLDIMNDKILSQDSEQCEKVNN